MSTPTEATGIFASDLLIRHAILQGFKELRANDWLLDFVCQGLKQDLLTKDIYGQKEIDALRNWFLRTNIPVICYGRLGDVEAPSVTINLQNSDEDQNTIGDIHYTPQEDVEGLPWPDLSDHFSPSFVPATGVVTVPVSVTADIFPGMVIIDAQGRPHEILTVESDRVFTIASGTPIDFRGATLRAGSPNTIQTLESALFKETYLIGCNVNGEPLQLIFLHSIICFVFLWGRETLLEGRGFEKSSFTSSDFAKNMSYDQENIWTRYVTLTGSVRQCWPKRRFAKITGLKTRIRPIGSRLLPPDSQPPADQSWIGEDDSIG